MTLAGMPGAKYHISFPILNRSSFGIFGSMWPVFNRGAMACVWYGVQSWLGGQCIVLMFRAIGPSYNNLPNSLPASSGTNTRDFVGFFVFWLLQLPALYFPVYSLRHLFTVKSVIVPLAGVLFFAWAVAKANGLGPIVSQKGTLTGSDRAWAWVQGIMSCLANFATLIVNNPDFTRFSATPKSPVIPQLLTIPLGFSITSFIGVIVGSSSKAIYGEAIWNPLDLLSAFLDHDPSSATRAGVFFIAAAFALAQLGVNIAANSISAGNDLSALVPKFLNIRRAAYLCAIVGLCMCPWNLLSSSSTFTTYLSAYSTFLSSIAGVMFSDYYLVRKQHLRVNSFYRSEGIYFFTLGVNWRGYAAYVAGILINVVGFAGAVGTPAPMGATYIYRLSFFTGYIVAASVYYGLHRLSPMAGCTEEELMRETDSFEESPSKELSFDDEKGVNVSTHKAGEITPV